ncbi:CpaF family protein [Candidatus Omnitrophota bacterium]
MEKKELQHIESELLSKLAGKINLLQEDEEKEKIVLDVLSEVCGFIEKDALLNQIKALSTEEERKQFTKDFLSFGVVAELLGDPYIEDIIINALNPIFVHHSEKGLIKTQFKFESEKELDLFIKKLVIFSGRSELRRINNFELPNIQGRVNIILSPLGPQITITKAKSEPLSVIDLIEKSSLNYDLAAQLWMYLEGFSVRPANIIISGGPGSGKTTLLNALFSFVPSNERMVIIEDTLELNTQFEESCSRLESDEHVDLTELVKNSLRMRPDRIIIGEVRGAEAKDLMTAVNIGKNCMGTIHASTPREAIIRMQNEPMNVPEILVGLVDVFVIMKKFAVKDKVYRVVEELVETGGMEKKTVLLSQVWKYDYDQNIIQQVSPSTIYRDKLSRSSGIEPLRIIEEVKIRSKILQLLHKKNITTMKEVTTFCRAYNADPDGTLSGLGVKREELLKD